MKSNVRARFVLESAPRVDLRIARRHHARVAFPLYDWLDVYWQEPEIILE